MVDYAFYICFLEKILKFRQFANHLHSLDSTCEINILSLEEHDILFSTKKKTQLTNTAEDNS